ncbi:MAG: cupin domain-containing protein [Candidatus Dormibacteraeota bacterium]|nr:cupin domain-containing protein [Candidatus Dormibacteraeota bacterium]
MIATQIGDLELMQGWSDTDPTMKVGFQFPVSALTGAASTSVVYFEMAPGEHCGRHTHTAEEILLILEGSGEAEANGERAKVRTGALALIPAMAPHDVHNTGKDTLRCIGFFSSAALVTVFEDTMQPLGAKEVVIGQAQRQPEEAIPARG